MPVPPDPKLYHLTHGLNLPAIIESGALLSKAVLMASQRAHEDVSVQAIQRRRQRLAVPLALGGTLHDYVPLFFAPRAPMLYKVAREGRVQGGQHGMLHLVTSARAVELAGLGYAFTDGHAVMRLSRFFDDLGDLDQLDWPVVLADYWADSDDDNDRQRRKQAEFLVRDRLPWSLVTEIGVMTAVAAARVSTLLDSSGVSHRPAVQVRPEWYYEGLGAT